MRLINIKTGRLEEFFDDSIPKYAILSHTWGANEVLYSHIQESGYKGGSTKIDGCCAQAARDGLDYVWIDTCCIDKSSSADLSEAINSMFAWYRDSAVCYAYLADVPDDEASGKEGPGMGFAKSRWFTRGWTLQELLAPDNVVFFSASWSPIGRKRRRPEDAPVFGEGGQLSPNQSSINKYGPTISTISNITKIPKSCLHVSSIAFRTASVAQKMSWAAGRKTSRKEDRAYSLLGIFGVNMPMLYGEGDKAFLRLQEEIMKLTDDQSLLAWGFGLPLTSYASSLLAKSPDDFSECGDIFCTADSNSGHHTMTNNGLLITLTKTDALEGKLSCLARLGCVKYWPEPADYAEAIVLPLVYDRVKSYTRDPDRVPMLNPFTFSDSGWNIISTESSPMYLRREMEDRPLQGPLGRFSLVCEGFDLIGGVTECYPEPWIEGLVADQSSPFIFDHSSTNPILVKYSGGAVPPFICKIMPRGVWGTGHSLSCLVTWMPDIPMSTTLADLMVKGLKLTKQTHPDSQQKWFEALDNHWALELEDHLEWTADLVSNNGTHLSVRIEAAERDQVDVRFEISGGRT